MKRRHVNNTTNLCVYLSAVVLFFCSLAHAEGSKGYPLPLFRLDAEAPAPVPPAGPPVRLLVDGDFPPYSFTASSGAPAGLAVELALAACAELGVRCDVIARPFDQVFPALLSGEGDVIVTGPRLDEAALRQALMTRPYFRSLGRFAVQSGDALAVGDARSLSGKRIGVVKDTVHARWLETYYGNSEIVAFADESMAGEALRTGNIDTMFGDNVRLIYWVAGDVSRGCCRLLGGAYSDFDHFSRNLVFLTRLDRPDLRAAFDYGLDRSQKNGTTERIFNAYLPLSPW
jgi:polar amino acid transport system substrate-binding protein